MRITDIRIREVSIPRIYDTYTADPDQLQPDTDHTRSRYQIIELLTDTGHVGLGEVSDIAKRMNPLSAPDLKGFLEGHLSGVNLDSWRTAYDAIARSFSDTYHPELRALTLFGIEIALLDLVGKRYGAPLFELLGGRYRDHVPVCWVIYMRGDVDEDEELRALEDEVKGKLSEGITAFKMKVGEDHARDLRRIARFREIVGPHIYLRVDASGAWSEKEAIAKLEDIAKAGVNACETPVNVVSRPIVNDNPDQINRNPDLPAAVLARVRENCRIQIIEHAADLNDSFTSALVRHQAVDVINIIPSQGCGILRAQRLIYTAETGGIPVLLGSTVEMGPGTAAFVHLALATRNVSVTSDLVSPGLLVDDVCTQRFRYKEGNLNAFEGPGLGVELDESKIEKWSI
jgi:muconate cycloisomerase